MYNICFTTIEDICIGDEDMDEQYHFFDGATYVSTTDGNLIIIYGEQVDPQQVYIVPLSNILCIEITKS